MKILIAAAQFSSGISGLQRHALTLTECLIRQPEVAEVHFVLAPWQQQLMQRVGLDFKDRFIMHIAEMNRGFVSRNVWYYHHFPRLVARIQPDIVHLSYPVPVNRSSIRRPIVLTLHDLYPYDIPSNFGFPKVLFNQAILQQCLSSADAVACVSDTTLSSLKRYVSPAVWDKAVRIHNCVQPTLECSQHSPLPRWNSEPFFLSVSQHRRNKNIPLLLDVFCRLLDGSKIDPHTKLVVIGINGPETKHIKSLVNKLELSEKVLFLDGLTEAALQWCYRHCELLIAPSEIEGFGLPVAEALLAGSRVVCSDIPAFREIDQEHCHFARLGPHATENLIEAICAGLNHPRPLPISLPQFSPAVLGAQYLNLYRSLSPALISAPHVQYPSSIHASNPAEPSL